MTKSILRVALAAVLTLAALLSCQAQTAPSFVIVPDPHLNFGYESRWAEQAAWIVANKATYNIWGVFCSGDWSSGATYETDLGNAWTYGMDDIDAAGFVWGSATGNHDSDTGNITGEADRVHTVFQAQLGSARNGAKPWYLGYWSGDSQRTTWALKYVEPTTGRRFLVIFLELYPRAGALTWAGTILSAFPNHEAIIITHSYMHGSSSSNALFAATDNYGPNSYGLAGDASGETIEAWAATFANVRAVFCGHDVTTGLTGARVDTNAAGFALNGIFQDWQTDGDQATRRLRLITLGASTASVRTVATDTGVVGAAATIDWRPSGSLYLPSPTLQ